jgi:hypothetical protein
MRDRAGAGQRGRGGGRHDGGADARAQGRNGPRHAARKDRVLCQILGSVFDRWVRACPLDYRSPNASLLCDVLTRSRRTRGRSWTRQRPWVGDVDLDVVAYGRRPTAPSARHLISSRSREKEVESAMAWREVSSSDRFAAIYSEAANVTDGSISTGRRCVSNGPSRAQS